MRFSPASSPPHLTVTRAVLWLLLALGLLGLWRGWVVQGLPLSVDESYYVAWSKTLDWGYWTKPPLIAWSIALARETCGPTSGCVRAVPLLLYPLSALLFFVLARRLQDNTLRALGAALAFASLPLTSFYGLAATTDAWLLFCWMAAMCFLWEALMHQPKAWLGVGLCVGLGLLAKYSMSVFGLCAFIALLLPRWRHHWASPWPYMAAGVALLVFAPNLIWNLQNGAPTLRHTAEISAAGGGYRLNIASFVAFVAAQWVIATPILVGAFVASFWASPSPARERAPRAFLLCMSLPMLAVIAVQALAARAHANWAAPALIGVVMLGALQLGHRRVAWTAVFAFNLVFAAALYHYPLLVAKPLGLQASKFSDPFWGLRNWPDFIAGVERELDLRGLAPSWRVASDDRAVLAQLQANLNLPAGAAMGWRVQEVAQNHFDQRFPLTLTDTPVLLVTRQAPAVVLRDFPQAQAVGDVRSEAIAEAALRYHLWWLPLTPRQP